jgi:hypothetical protein
VAGHHESQSAFLAFAFHVGVYAPANEVLIVIEPLSPRGPEREVIANDGANDFFG